MSDQKRRAGGTQRLRVLVLGRDHGICALCSFDAPAEERRLVEMQERGDQVALQLRIGELRSANFNPVFNRRLRSLWDLDHIVAVVDGGNDELSNLRTLCTPCHKGATAELLRGRMAGRGEALAL